MANTGGDVDSYTQHGKTLASPWVKLGTYPVLSSSGFSEDGSIAVFDNALRQVWVVDREGKVVLHKTSDVTMAATSPDGRRLAILYDLRVAIFDAHTGAEIGGAIGVPPGSTDIEWSSDGSRILAFGQDEGQLIDAVSVQPLGDPLPSSGFLALRSDGNEVASMSNGAVLLWNTNLPHLREAACFAAGRNMTQAEWSQYLPNQGPYQRVCSQWP
jgi:WD40 repeat protein